MFMSLEKNVLIIEDDELLQSLAVSKLKASGFEVFAAVNNESAQKIMESENISVVLLDLLLPNVDGFGILEAIRNNEKTKDIPVVVFSNLAEEKDVIRAKELGATDFLIKSNFTLDELVSKIEEVLKK